MSINTYPEFSKNNPFGSQAKMLYHIDRLNNYVETGDTHPIFMEINLTDICNLKCSWCISQNRQNNTLNPLITKKFLNEFKKFGGKAITFSGGGEPTLHKDFVELTQTAYDIGLELGLMTNGVFGPRIYDCIHLFKWIRVSLNVVDSKRYEQLKGINLVDIALKNIEHIFKMINRPKLGINCNVGDDFLIDDVDLLINKTYDICDYIQFRPVLPRYFKEENPYINKEVWDYLLNTYMNNSKINLSIDKFKDVSFQTLFPFSSCEAHYFSPILDANGDVKVCIYHPGDSRFTFGNIYKNSFKEIWESERRKKTVEFVRNFDYKNNCQMCCKLWELNKLLDFINDKHANDEFIVEDLRIGDTIKKYEDNFFDIGLTMGFLMHIDLENKSHIINDLLRICKTVYIAEVTNTQRFGDNEYVITGEDYRRYDKNIELIYEECFGVSLYVKEK